MKRVSIVLVILLLVHPVLASAERVDAQHQDISVQTDQDNRQGMMSRFRMKFSDMSKEKKAIVLNAAVSTGILTYGVVFWNYSIANTPHAQAEGWFESDSGHGGVDKLGHFYTGYVMGDMFSHAYDNWGFSRRNSSILAFLSSVTFTTVMEIGDAFSDFGLSYEDLISNITGAAASYLLHEYPELDEKIDLRVEYWFSGESDISTDYAHMKFIMALKAEGFEEINHGLLKYLELHLGYYAEGFEDAEAFRERNIYLGLGINLSRLFRKKSRALSTLFTYYQTPYTYLPIEKSFESRH